MGEAERAMDRRRAEAVAAFEAIIASDHTTSRNLASGVDVLERELALNRDAMDTLHQQMQHEQIECLRLKREQQQLEDELKMRRARVSSLTQRRKVETSNGIALRRDRQHARDEIAFLQRKARNECKLIETMRRVNQRLDQTYCEVEQQTEVMEAEHQVLAHQIQEDRARVSREQRVNAEMRANLEAMAAQVKQIDEADAANERVDRSCVYKNQLMLERN